MSVVVVDVCAWTAVKGRVISKAIAVKKAIETGFEADAREPKQLLKVVQQRDIHISVNLVNSPDKTGRKAQRGVSDLEGVKKLLFAPVGFSCYEARTMLVLPELQRW